jgi:hypothetical protein
MGAAKSLLIVRVLAIYLGLHVTLASVSAFKGFLVSLDDAEIAHWKLKQLPTVVEQYGGIFAANQGFSFFAPGVSSEARVVVLGCQRGRTNWHGLDVGLKGESEHFLNSFVGMGIKGPARKAVSESIGAYALSRYSDVDSVIIQYQAELIPPLREKTLTAREWITLETFFYYR